MKTFVAILMAAIMVGMLAGCNDSANATTPQTLNVNGIEMPVIEDTVDEAYNCHRITAQRETTAGIFWKGTHVVDGTPVEGCYCIRFPDGTVQGSQLVEQIKYTDTTSAILTVVHEYDLTTGKLRDPLVKLVIQTTAGDDSEAAAGIIDYGRTAPFVFQSPR